MKYTIVCNEMKWPVDPVEIWEGGTNGLPLQNATTTGYYLKKYVNNTISFEAGSTVTKNSIIGYCSVMVRFCLIMQKL